MGTGDETENETRGKGKGIDQIFGEIVSLRKKEKNKSEMIPESLG